MIVYLIAAAAFTGLAFWLARSYAYAGAVFTAACALGFVLLAIGDK